MLKHPPADPAVRIAESWAEVRAHDQVIRYRRLGAGRAVLLVLSPADDPEALWPDLLEALGPGRRLIIPEPPLDDADVPCWLGGFLEGLGMRNVAVVAVGRFCIPVLELAFLGLDQVARMVLVLDGPEAEALETAMRQATVPLLVVRRDQSADEVLPLVTDFLGGVVR